MHARTNATPPQPNMKLVHVKSAAPCLHTPRHTGLASANARQLISKLANPPCATPARDIFFNLPKYKQRVQQAFDVRTTYEANNTFHPQLASKLLEFAQLKPGQSVLDIATGTGLVAYGAARIVSPSGRVVGLDCSPGMLMQAKQKLAGLDAGSSVSPSFFLADIESCSFPSEWYNAILNSAFMPFLQDLPKALKTWHSWLKPGGTLVFNCFGDPQNPEYGLYITVAEEFGLLIEDCNTRLGTVERCYEQMARAGYVDVEVQAEMTLQEFSKTPQEYVDSIWRQCASNPFFPLTEALGTDELTEFEEVFKSRALAGAQSRVRGACISNPVTTFMVKGRK